MSEALVPAAAEPVVVTGRAVGQFLAWCEARGLWLTDVSPIHVAAYIRTHPGSVPNRETAPCRDPAAKLSGAKKAIKFALKGWAGVDLDQVEAVAAKRAAEKQAAAKRGAWIQLLPPPGFRGLLFAFGTVTCGLRPAASCSASSRRWPSSSGS